MEDLALFENPESGFVFNVNNSAYHGSVYEENLNPKDFNSNMGYNEKVNNRSARVYELLEKYPGNIDWNDFLDIKFDHTYPKDTFYFMRDFSIMELYQIDTVENPDLADAVRQINAFDGTTDSLERNFGVLMFALYEIYDRSEGRAEELENDKEARLKLFTDCVRLAKNHMIKHFGTIDMAYKDIYVLERGGKTVPVNGGPGNIRSAFAKKMDDGSGRMRIWIGDSFVQLVRFTKDGPEIYSASPFGATNRPERKHYNDQMELYSKQQFKKMSLEKQYWLDRAEEIYSPE